MKMITAIIKPDKLDEVREKLVVSGIIRITVSRVTGHGRQENEEIYRGQSVVPNLIPKVRLDIACNDGFVKTACEVIVKAARTGDGSIGDGKVFVTPLEECIRIRTNERGEAAI